MSETCPSFVSSSPLRLRCTVIQSRCGRRRAVDHRKVGFARVRCCAAEQEEDGRAVPHPTATYYFQKLKPPPRVALTREKGKNEPLQKLLEKMYSLIEVLELPCVQTVKLDDGIAELSSLLLNHAHDPIDWIIITSPESAHIFVELWKKLDFPDLAGCKFAVVGKSTGSVLRAMGFSIDFTPSKATGKTLVSEFPQPSDDSAPEKIVYPASLKAPDVITKGLAKRFGEGAQHSVKRINTYSTEHDLFSEDKIDFCKGCHIVTFASPSAVDAWAQNIGVDERVIVACIGETSATAAKEVGFTRVHYPDRPGLDGWMTAVGDAMQLLEQNTQEHNTK